MTGAPDVGAGTDTNSVPDALPATTTGVPGALGGGTVGVIGAEGSDRGEADDPLKAVTVKVYDVPLVSPMMLQDVSGAVISHRPAGALRAGEEVTTYRVGSGPLALGVIVTVAN